MPATAPASCSTASSTFRAATGCWSRDAFEPAREITATVAWLDDEPLVAGRVYWALQGHRWVKAKVARIVDRRRHPRRWRPSRRHQLEANAIGDVVLTLQQPLAVLPFAQSRALGSLVLVDTASHKTSGRRAGQRQRAESP